MFVWCLMQTLIKLNNSLWGPNFIFPSMGIFLMMFGPDTHMVNLYVWGIFITFEFIRYWQSIVDFILYLIWLIISTAKEHFYGCTGYA